MHFKVLLYRSGLSPGFAFTEELANQIVQVFKDALVARKYVFIPETFRCSWVPDHEVRKEAEEKLRRVLRQ